MVEHTGVLYLYDQYSTNLVGASDRLDLPPHILTHTDHKVNIKLSLRIDDNGLRVALDEALLVQAEYLGFSIQLDVL